MVDGYAPVQPEKYSSDFLHQILCLRLDDKWRYWLGSQLSSPTSRLAISDRLPGGERLKVLSPWRDVVAVLAIVVNFCLLGSHPIMVARLGLG